MRWRVQEHSFLAVAFYSPGCGHCRRLLPSWTRAAELLEDQQAPIRLARMDIASRGGMRAWKVFGFERVPAVKARRRRCQCRRHLFSRKGSRAYSKIFLVWAVFPHANLAVLLPKSAVRGYIAYTHENTGRKRVLTKPASRIASVRLTSVAELAHSTRPMPCV